MTISLDVFQLQDNDEKKDSEKDDVMYADLDKAAMGPGKQIDDIFSK